jgi:AcrR family transcriptional regulator
VPRPFKDSERTRVRETGISKGNFYSFFPSREDFILSVLESRGSEYRGALLAETLAIRLASWPKGGET